jgi:hypothetical protein
MAEEEATQGQAEAGGTAERRGTWTESGRTSILRPSL